MRERKPGLGCIGLPGMLAALAFLAFALTVPARGVLIGVVAVVVVFLVVGIAATQAKKRD